MKSKNILLANFKNAITNKNRKEIKVHRLEVVICVEEISDETHNR